MAEESVLKPGASSKKGFTAKYKKEVIQDYKLCMISREASFAARREVLTGKAKFGIIQIYAENKAYVW